MQEFKLNFIDLNLGYSYFYSTTSIKNSILFDITDASLICNLIYAYINSSIQFWDIIIHLGPGQLKFIIQVICLLFSLNFLIRKELLRG